ncbi:sensor histidine kinase [Streptomyces sp. HNM0575]|uniref:ATP-binding protein n=1 Tax=Streptomyces sp. HNM0575 TaxID=2716338 RepID=UPI00145F2AE7|nr:sensor histidine kinase [Streptomyces sp. HNM0575]NLU73799.1 sensor histidine kinase [Streptomyces sp. HNM0575]
MQLTIATGVAALITAFFLAPLSDELDERAMDRALAIAQTTAARPEIAHRLVADSGPSADGAVQQEAEKIRRATGAGYVVVLDTRGIRWSHPERRRVGRHVSTDPSAALAGHEVRHIDEGTLGRSARGKVPLRDEHGEVVGAVSVGIAYEGVREKFLGAVPKLLAYAGGALAIGVVASVLVSRRLQRQTHDLAFSDISALLDEREAMLHGIREGVVALDADGRIRLVNDEAQRLLELSPEDTGRPLAEVLGPGRTADVLCGSVTGTDLLTVSGGRVLVANRMPTDDGGAVATFRDRTELELLGRELDGSRGLIDALRAQDHEHANRMHLLLGLLQLGQYEEAAAYLSEAVGVHRATAEQIAERVEDPLLAALLVGKATVAAERGVALRLTPATRLPDRLVDPRELATVLGNLVDNALDAAAGSADAMVEVDLRAEHIDDARDHADAHTTHSAHTTDTDGSENGEAVTADEADDTGGAGGASGFGGSGEAPANAEPRADSGTEPVSEPVTEPAAGPGGTGPGREPGPDRGTAVVLGVADSGPGIPGDQRELVFAEGWSTKEPPAHRQRGLGLALVRRLAERHGGSARVGEAACGGAEFTVVLPQALHPAGSSAHRGESPAASGPAPGNAGPDGLGQGSRP